MLKDVAAKGRTAEMSGYQAVYGAAGCSNCGAHEIRVDPEGNVWVVDAPGQVIIKMNASGHTLMTLGTRDKRGKSHDLILSAHRYRLRAQWRTHRHRRLWQ